MDVVQIVLVVVLVLVGIFCGVAIWALRDIVLTSRSVRTTSEELRLRAVPLLEKADVSVDAFNVELLRIDGIITQFENTSSRVSHASSTISGIVSAPAEAVSEAASRMRQAWKDRKREQPHGPTTEKDADHQESDSHVS